MGHQEFPNPSEGWEYTFQPLKTFPIIAIMRYEWPRTPNVGEEDKTVHFYQRASEVPSPAFNVFSPPFQDFPTIKSHVHPFFAIYNAGLKMSDPDDRFDLPAGVNWWPNVSIISMTFGPKIESYPRRSKTR